MMNCRVLLIDDEEELVTTLVERLEIRGICADAMTNGHDALEKMRDVDYHVVVADLKMPGLSGPEVIEIIKKRYPKVKIVLITGHGNTAHSEQEYPVNEIDEILMKPFHIDNLIEAISRVLDISGEEKQ